MESHGGYLLRTESLDASSLIQLARRALAVDGVEDLFDVSLLVSVVPHRKVIRLGFDAPFTYGRRGAHWYLQHHALARLLSREWRTVVHAYVYDVDEMEQVHSYGNGASVGGETLYVDEVELPDEWDLEDEVAWERVKQKWPLGHLARVYGVSRDELVRMPKYAQSVLVDLASPRPKDLDVLATLLPRTQQAKSA